MEDEIKDLIPTIYKDVAQPTAQKLGQVFSSLVGLVVGPVGKAAEIGEKNLVNLVAKLEKIDPKDAQPVPPELGVPIFERLKYTRGEELVNLYTELFLKASQKTTESSAHPSYFEVITNLSLDEARVVEFLSRDSIGSEIPYLRIDGVNKENSGYIVFLQYFTLLGENIDFLHEYSEQVSIVNLIRLGILVDAEGTELLDESEYARLLESPNLEPLKAEIEKQGKNFRVKKSFLRVTAFGSRFIDTCVPSQ
ncbi:DUF4393 domain-containing protein [Patescibacteria group bacterium]|nr:DUF4393 domain-containing protein [Patescibacteria group bacterium]